MKKAPRSSGDCKRGAVVKEEVTIFAVAIRNLHEPRGSIFLALRL